VSSLREAAAESVVLVAVSAGEELEQEAHRRWKDEKPDEYFFLEIYGSAVVEHLVMMTGARLCAAADASGLAVLPHYSPGYPEWDIADQAPLFELIARDNGHSVPGRVNVLESGMLRPKKSLLAVFGLTRATDHVRKLTDLVPCQNCTLPGCEYRRAAYLRPRRRSEVESMRSGEDASSTEPSAASLERNATYSVNAKALRRWASERLSLMHNDDGTADADNAIGPDGATAIFHVCGACAPGRQAGCCVTRTRGEGQDIRTDFDDRVVVARHGADCRWLERTWARRPRQ
jgi:hypothetical protein